MRIAAPLRLLIADDNPLVASSMAEIIHLALPCVTVLVHDGTEALRRTCAERPDVAILDLHMPGLNGLQVAQRLREIDPEHAPYLIAVTGLPSTAADAGAIAACFDRAFSKPLDVDQLLNCLAGLLEAPDPAANVDPAPALYDVGELLTKAARQVAPVARHLSFSFDFRGPALVASGDPLAVQSGVHRLMLAAVDALGSGFLLFAVDTVMEEDGRGRIAFEAAGTGHARDGLQMASIMERLGLRPVGAGAADGSDLVAVGTCPNTGEHIEFRRSPKEGFSFRIGIDLGQVTENPATADCDAAGALAWIVHSGETLSTLLKRRLQRLGWSVNGFASCPEALQAWTGLQSRQGRWAPSLLVVVEGAPAMLDRADTLARALGATTVCVLAVYAGSSRLGSQSAPLGYELRVHPFSPLELARFTQRLAPAAVATSPSPLAAISMRDRPRVLLVDDNELNRTIGQALLEAIGYEVRLAFHGLDAVDACRQSPPDLVVMDLNMPVLGGLDATLQLRRMQRAGELPPFPILACTADATDDTEDACRQVGMDAFLTKPLRVGDLRLHLQRLLQSE